ncbi:putative Zn-dependent peptidase [Virgibacillus natechei]|uniref:Zn-dependent peptidase n=1 Tax=Virgibacillus natechei TaxID=1216297 RepID=A0ABS4IAX5_9BACI|nr:pitrilysin family protein [Virgibacillus natechei]MBP1968040.1 putative Zn-dependent peptidase [Virgibacillus natechei]UZD14678.1 insulinase family protein [Virgibacillus natechei]
MNKVEEKVVNENGMNIHFIQSNKFKTINIVAKFKSPLERETITNRALLPYILKQGTKSYPSRQNLQLKLDDLYGAVLSIDGAKKGENHIISFRLELANEKYIPEESSILEEGISLFSELLFQPNVSNNAFEEAAFNREKDTLKQKMNAIKDNKMSFANMRLIDEMCEGEPYQLHVHGYEEDLRSVTAETLYDYYKSMLTEDMLDIYVLGDFDEADAKEKLIKSMKRKEEKPKSEEAQQNKSERKQIDEPKEIIEEQKIQQAKLHIGYRTNATVRDQDYYALQVFNGMFGGFPSSKLFINVREKNSLAYYAASRLESHKGLLLVLSGIAPNDFEKARDIIKEQMSAMKAGDFTDTELNETKELVVNQLLEIMDNPQGMIELLYQQVLADKEMKPDQLIANIKKVTKDDVLNVAGNIEEDTVYLLTSEGGNSNE